MRSAHVQYVSRVNLKQNRWRSAVHNLHEIRRAAERITHGLESPTYGKLLTFRTLAIMVHPYDSRDTEGG